MLIRYVGLYKNILISIKWPKPLFWLFSSPSPLSSPHPPIGHKAGQLSLLASAASSTERDPFSSQQSWRISGSPTSLWSSNFANVNILFVWKIETMILTLLQESASPSLRSAWINSVNSSVKSKRQTGRQMPWSCARVRQYKIFSRGAIVHRHRTLLRMMFKMVSSKSKSS